jgi:hypothetical protein
MGDFYGLNTATISNGFLTLEYLLDAGPRLVRLFYKENKENIFAEIPDRSHTTDCGTYFFRGGHRLWHAPEDILRTYIPDNDPVSVAHSPAGVTLIQPVESGTGIQKSVEIILDKNSARVTVHHSLHNHGLWAVNLSAWAITQFPLGGMAIFPQMGLPVDTAGLLPNRNLALWSYTSLNDSRLSLADDLIAIRATSALPPLKIGYTNRAGWIAYCRNSILFIKHFFPLPDLPHPDFSCNVETYCGDQFIELETLSPITTVDPGQSLHHTEIWDILPNIPTPANLNDIRQLINQGDISSRSTSATNQWNQ